MNKKETKVTHKGKRHQTKPYKLTQGPWESWVGESKRVRNPR